jgi:hydrogenase-4 component F
MHCGSLDVHELLVLVPLVFALGCLASPDRRVGLASLVAGTLAHLGVAAWSWSPHFPGPADPLFALEPLGHLFITLISVLFAATAVYFVGYERAAPGSHRAFFACMLGLEAALAALCMSRSFGVLWVTMAAASLAATPLIYFRLSARSLEATWKFLLMNSVGIAIALTGIFCIAIATEASPRATTLDIAELVLRARELDAGWLRAGFLLALVGFGTKLGLAPLHGWKPDAYGEAPPPVAALLAGGMSLGALLGILRVFQVCAAAGLGPFAGRWLVAFGLLSIAVAAVFIAGNGDYRRILAYTSVEHMGVMAVGAGLGAGGAHAAMLHAMHNTLNKGVLFLVAGVFLRAFESSRTSDVRGALRHHPAAALLFLGGLCATCGLPPFGMFYSEVGVLLSAAEGARWWVVALFALTVCMVFVAVMTALLPVVFGPPAEPRAGPPAASERWRGGFMLAPAAALLLAALVAGSWQPEVLRRALADAAGALAPAAREGAP